jgi:SNF2 family DNA or RNA helicase
MGTELHLPMTPISPASPSPAEQSASDATGLPAPECLELSMNLRADVFASGINGALRRQPVRDSIQVGLAKAPALGPAWKPIRVKLRTFGLTFPEGIAFQPPKGDSPHGEPRSIRPPAPVGDSSYHEAARKPTRLKPPDGALSLEDRLFYVLQPPLESWLSGQELIMPFEPFSYQYEGIAWLFAHKSGLLADEMGLGKTMQTITAVRLLLRSGQIRRVLIVCPKPLIPNWLREFKMWAEELPIVTVEGDAARRQMLWSMPGISILIANYELLVRDFDNTAPEALPRFDLVVLDEAQRVKNRDSRTAEIARSLGRKRSWALTGTPIENRIEELAALFEFMEVLPPRGTPDARQLSQLTAHYVLRRTKDLVMSDLPPRLDRDEHLELAPAQQQAYKTAEKEGVIHLNDLGESITIQHVFELILRLKQITNFDPLTGESSKLDRLVAEMEEIAESGGKAILFSQWTGCLDWLEARLKRFGPLLYHGGVPSKKREAVLEQFRDDPRRHILLMSYGTGAVGLNLQFAGYVFLFDRWWNPAVEDQAINRAHRIGQKNPVIVTRFISKDTIEERIDSVLRQKRELFQSILGDGGGTNASLSLNAAEIFGLFDLKARAPGDAKPSDPPESAAA